MSKGSARKGRRKAKGNRKGSPFRGVFRFAWGIVMAAVLLIFALSVAYRLQEPDAESVHAGLVTESRVPSITVVILNGCGEAGLAAYARDVMLPEPRFDVVEVGNADDSRYEETLIADVGGDADAAHEVARYLRRKLGVGRVIRHNINDPQADVVVILGADAKRVP